MSVAKIILAAHGSRSLEANAAIAELARGLGQRLDVQVYPAYLEMAEPTITSAVREAASDGARRIVIVPFFLAPGMHVQRDLARIVEQARRELGVPIVIADFFGSHPSVPELLTDIASAALARPPDPGLESGESLDDFRTQED